MSQQTEKSDFVSEFVSNLGELKDGERARLKRNAGKSLNESHNVLGLFYRKLMRGRKFAPEKEDIYFLVATLYPFEKRPSRKEGEEEIQPPKGNFGTSMRKIRDAAKNKTAEQKDEQGNNSVDRMELSFERLLDADEQQLPFYLRREVRFLFNEAKTRADGRVNWEQLLRDLLKWHDPRRYIQRHWARAYFTTQPQKPENEFSG